MTLPTSIILPLRVNYQNNEDMDRYLRDLVFELQDMYEKIAENVNGYIRNNAETDQAKWIPTIQGTGSGTTTYTQQVGWSIRQGIYTELFFDVIWSATTASGNLYLELPYKVANSTGMPFVGVLQPSSISFGAGRTNLVINAIPNTYRGEIWSIGSGVATSNLTVKASGRIIGYIKYIGLENE
jgi:hypothetical protein